MGVWWRVVRLFSDVRRLGSLARDPRLTWELVDDGGDAPYLAAELPTEADLAVVVQENSVRDWPRRRWSAVLHGPPGDNGVVIHRGELVECLLAAELKCRRIQAAERAQGRLLMVDLRHVW